MWYCADDRIEIDPGDNKDTSYQMTGDDIPIT